MVKQGDNLSDRQKRIEELEAELAESKARFRMVTDNSADGIAMLEYDRFVYLSTYFKKLLSIKDFDINKLHRNDLIARIYEEDRERIASAISEARINKIPHQQYEFRFKKKDDSIIWIHNSVTREYDAQGVNCRTLINGRDITEQKMLFEKLRKSEEAFKTIFNKSNAVKLIIDLETGNIEEANDAAVEFYGYPRETLLAKRITDINTLSVEEVLEKMRQAGQQVEGVFNFKHRTADGNIKNVRVYSAQIDIDGKKKLISHIYDITDRIETEKKLTESNELLRETGRMAKVGGWSFKEGVDYVYWSEEVCLLFEVDTGYKPTLKEAINHWHPEHRPIITKAVEELLQEGKSYDLELKIFTAKGSERWLHTIGRPIYEGDRIIGAKGIAQDITERKHFEVALQISEQRLRSAIESVGDGVWDWNLITNEVYFSDEWKQMLGFEENEIVGSVTEWEKRVHPDDFENTVADIKSYLQGKSSEYRNIHRVKCKSGDYKWILDRGKIIERDENNIPVRMIGTHIDIDDRIKMEEELRQNQRLLVEMGKMAKVGRWSFTEGDDYVNWTDEVYLLHEVDANEKPKVEEAINFFHPDHRQILQTAIEQTLSTGKSYDLQLKIITAKNNERWLHTIGKPIYERDRIIGAKGTVQDITDRKVLEIELRKSEENFKTLFSLHPDFVNIVRISDSKIIAVNDYFANQLSDKPDEIIGKTTLELNIWVEPEQRQLLLDEMLKKKGHRNFEAKFRRKDGTIFTGMVSAVVFDFYGEPHMLIVTRDISDLKRAEQLLKESNNTKDKLFSIIGHDLKNPIHGIKGSASLLLNRCEKKDCENVPKLAGNIRNSAYTALGILEDLLTWSKVQSGKLEKMPEQVNALEIIENTILSHKAAADRKNISINLDIDPNLQLNADLQMLSTILRNLISNAIKFTHSGGIITIKGEEKNDAAAFSVQDTGIGMKPDMIRRLFRVGEDVSRTGTDHEEGTGLGLILCKEFVEKHNGKIWVESQPGKGSTFSFTLPLK